MTKARRALIDLFAKEHRPMDVDEIAKGLKVSAHKVTLYRELKFLTAQGIVREVTLKGDRARYESADLEHHHHVVCVKCDDVADVKFDEDIERQQKAIEKKTKFQILTHSLEFFGVCAKCR